jgi:dUTP pyrophosphatase
MEMINKMQTLQYTKSHPDAMLSKTHEQDAGIDLHLVEDVEIDYDTKIIDTGISVVIPEGNVGLLFLRSSAGIKKHLRMANHVGVIDSGFTDTIKLALYYQYSIYFLLKGILERFNCFFKEKNYNYLIKLEKGDRVAQLVIVPFANLPLELVEQLPATNRGTGGIGSTGK